jgi:hypothetical protein
MCQVHMCPLLSAADLLREALADASSSIVGRLVILVYAASRGALSVLSASAHRW